MDRARLQGEQGRLPGAAQEGLWGPPPELPSAALWVHGAQQVSLWGPQAPPSASQSLLGPWAGSFQKVGPPKCEKSQADRMAWGLEDGLESSWRCPEAYTSRPRERPRGTLTYADFSGAGARGGRWGVPTQVGRVHGPEHRVPPTCPRALGATDATEAHGVEPHLRKVPWLGGCRVSHLGGSDLMCSTFPQPDRGRSCDDTLKAVSIWQTPTQCRPWVTPDAGTAEARPWDGGTDARPRTSTANQEWGPPGRALQLHTQPGAGSASGTWPQRGPAPCPGALTGARLGGQRSQAGFCFPGRPGLSWAARMPDLDPRAGGEEHQVDGPVPGPGACRPRPSPAPSPPLPGLGAEHALVCFGDCKHVRAAYRSFGHNRYHLDATTTSSGRWWMKELRSIQTRKHRSEQDRRELSSQEKPRRHVQCVPLREKRRPGSCRLCVHCALDQAKPGRRCEETRRHRGWSGGGEQRGV